MRQRKLQIFLSSTYEDLIEQRLAAMEAILKAGHIPAAMEQFSPGDETAWDRIRTWIDGSDAFILILGGRYGSLEPQYGKSYVQLEYEYAVERKKPFFAVVITGEHHEQRVKQFGLNVDERTYRAEYRHFRQTVTERLCGFWTDVKDIQLAILQKLPEWAQKPDLVGWVRGDELPAAEVTNEIARLSQENRQLRSQLAAQADNFEGLSFEDLVKLLREMPLDTPPDPDGNILAFDNSDESVAKSISQVNQTANAGELFDCLHEGFWREQLYSWPSRAVPKGVRDLRLHGLITFPLESHLGGSRYVFKLTEAGRRFRNRMLVAGDRDARRQLLWFSGMGSHAAAQ
jgi:hypothetical protein